MDIGGKVRHIQKPFIGNGFEEEILECHRCIRAGLTESDIHPVSHSIAVLEIMDTVRKQNWIVYEADK